MTKVLEVFLTSVTVIPVGYKSVWWALWLWVLWLWLPRAVAEILRSSMPWSTTRHQDLSLTIWCLVWTTGASGELQPLCWLTRNCSKYWRMKLFGKYLKAEKSKLVFICLLVLPRHKSKCTEDMGIITPSKNKFQINENIVKG